MSATTAAWLCLALIVALALWVAWELSPWSRTSREARRLEAAIRKLRSEMRAP